MHRTPFAGLTAPDPNDPITVDGGTFITRNPDLTDHFLRIGAVTHRHDGHPPVPNPVAPPSASVAASGGSIGPGVTIFAGYTVTDTQGGETTLSPVVEAGTPFGFGAPSGIVSASADYTGGGLPVGNYFYGKSNLDAGGGETPIGPMVQVTRQPGYASGQIKLSGLASDLVPGGPVAWHLWRSQDGQYMTLIASGTSDAFTDYGANCMLGADPTFQPPQIDTTRGTNLLNLTLPSADVAINNASAAQINVYLSSDGSFSNPSLYNVYPIASAGVTIQIPTLITANGEPPEVSTSIPGASPIVSSEIGDLQWLPPVNTASALPANPHDGDVRVAKDLRQIWIASGGVWGTGYDPDTGGGGAGSISEVGALPPGSGDVTSPGAILFQPASGTVISVTASGGSAVVTIGASGTLGPQGPPGPSGASGAQGIQGIQGIQGTQGPAGPPGGGGGAPNVSPSGASATGLTVSTASGLSFAGSGAAFVTVASAAGGSAVVTITAIPGVGPQGPAGPTGASGASGAQGPAGPPGASGASGAQGPQGPAGPAGAGGSGGSATALYSPSAAVYISSAGVTAGSGWVTQALEDFSSNHSNPPAGFTTLNGAAPLADQGYLYWNGAIGSNDAEVRWDAGGNVTDTMRVTSKFRAGGTNCQRMTLIALSVSTAGQDSSLALAYFPDGTIQLSVGAAGNWTVGSNAAGPTWTAADYWMRVTRNGNAVKGEIFTADPATGAAATATVNYTLTGADATALGAGVAGKAGVHSYFIGNADNTTRWYSLRTEATGTWVDSRHSEVDVYASGASGTVNRRLIDDQARSDFLVDVYASGASATGTFTRDVDALIMQGSGAAKITLGSAVSPNVAKAPGTSAAVVTVTAIPGVGPQGPAGPTGASGASGAQGPAGPTGAFVASASANVPTQSLVSATSLVGPFAEITVQGSGGINVALGSASAAGGASAVVVSVGPDDAAPWRREINPYSVLTSARTGTWGLLLDTSQIGGGGFYNTGGAQNDSASWDIDLSAGQWTLALGTWYDSNRGIVTVQLDGATVGTMDLYAAAINHNQAPSISFAVPTTGKHRIKLIAATKNASSTAYYIVIASLSFQRTS